MNSLNLVGNIVRELETKVVGDGITITKSAIAVNKKVKGQDKPMFIDVTFFGRTAEVANQYVKKGDKIALSGSLELDQWDDRETGQKRSKHTMAVNQMTLIGSGQQQAQSQQTQNYAQPQQQQQFQQQFQQQPQQQPQQQQQQPVQQQAAQQNHQQPQQRPAQQQQAGPAYQEPAFNPDDEIPF
jgi:single-strand DNA-binding protein